MDGSSAFAAFAARRQGGYTATALSSPLPKIAPPTAPSSEPNGAAPLPPIASSGAPVAANASLPLRGSAGPSDEAAASSDVAGIAARSAATSSAVSSTATPSASESLAGTAPAETAAAPTRVAANDDGDVRGSEIMPYDDGSLSASKGQSSAMNLVINFTEPVFAAGAAVFGLGLLVLPLLARLGLQKPSEDEDVSASFSYDSIANVPSQKTLQVFSEADLRKRFGVLDVSKVFAEIAMNTDELDDHVNECGGTVAEEETSRIQKWRDRVNANLRSLQKRSALAFLGLPPEASEAEVNKTYKKMALELHPDKGGDPEKFQELQEMKERLNDVSDEGKQNDDENTFDEEEAKAKREAEEKEKKEEQKVPADERMKKQRIDAHDNAVRLWERARKARDTIVGDKAIKSNPQPALNLLRSFVDRFVKSEINNLRHGPSKDAEMKLRKFVQQGAEIIAVAAIADVQTTLQTIAMSFNYRIVARTGSAEIKRLCTLLLEAISDVPVQAEALLRRADDALADAKERERRSKEERAAAQRAREARGDFGGDASAAGACGTAGGASSSSAPTPPTAPKAPGAPAPSGPRPPSAPRPPAGASNSGIAGATGANGASGASGASGAIGASGASAGTVSARATGAGGGTASASNSGEARAEQAGANNAGVPAGAPAAEGTASAEQAVASARASDPFADFDFSPRKAEPAKTAPAIPTPSSDLVAKAREASALVAKAREAPSTVAASQEKRSCWDPNFDHPYAGALKSNGTGIFCRPCQRWINTYEFNVEVFLTHVQRVHPSAPPGW
eukprot:TRINITY_DN62857_c0_g1_i1.p1 TRINITY_DN62857_c0_g1~~TRINITY_DN62857_c0_g1_i1.p1  ORF type:complete len:794 (+),score=191.48 TRINITY_DN62857_c0_g1_i1:58-2439(+)